MNWAGWKITKKLAPIKDWSTERAGGPRTVTMGGCEAMTDVKTPSKLEKILAQGATWR